MKMLDFENDLSSRVESSVDHNGSIVIKVKDRYPSEKEYNGNKAHYDDLWRSYIDIALSKLQSKGCNIPYFIKSFVSVHIHKAAKNGERWDVDC